MCCDYCWNGNLYDDLSTYRIVRYGGRNYQVCPNCVAMLTVDGDIKPIVVARRYNSVLSAIEWAEENEVPRQLECERVAKKFKNLLLSYDEK